MAGKALHQSTVYRLEDGIQKNLRATAFQHTLGTPEDTGTEWTLKQVPLNPTAHSGKQLHQEPVENSDRREGESGRVGSLARLRRIVALFKEIEREIQPDRLVHKSH